MPWGIIFSVVDVLEWLLEYPNKGLPAKSYKTKAI